MYFFSFLRKESVYLTILSLMVLCLGAPVNSKSQSFPQTERQSAGAVDPLLFNDRKHLPDLMTAAGNFLPNKNENSSLTAGELDPAFNPAVDSIPGNIRSFAKQPDGKLLIGGFFKNLEGNRSKSIARLNADNSPDTSFFADVNGTVFAVAVQTDGKIIIGGSFTVVNGTNQYHLARLNSDGSLDQTFDTGTGADNIIYDIAIQPDGKIVIGGSFNSINSIGMNYVARLDTDGTIDSSFINIFPTPPNSPVPLPPALIPGIVYSIAIQPDGKIILGGYLVLDYKSTSSVRQILRLNSNGFVDGLFDITMNSNLYKVALQPDGKVIAGGFFSFVNGENRSWLVRFNPDGTTDASFNPAVSVTAPVFALFIKPDGKILVGGLNVPAPAKQLNADGSLDVEFVSNQFGGGSTHAISCTSDGKTIVGGTYSSFDPDTKTAMLFDSSGMQVDEINTAALGGIRAIARQPDGKIIAGGNFNRVNGENKNRLIRFNPDGTIDETFDASVIRPSQINALMLQPNGKILVGGTYMNTGMNSSSIVRLNSDGSLDSSFDLTNLSFIGTVKAFARQPDGKILVSYGFDRLATRGSLTRLNSDGTADKSFSTVYPVSGILFEDLALQPDGKILAAGHFSISYFDSGTEETYKAVIRLNADGSHDRDFRPGFYNDSSQPFNFLSAAYALKLLPDGKVLVGGNLQADENHRVGIARLQTNGAIDETFQLNLISSSTELARVEDIEILPNGKLLAGGRFSDFGAGSSENITRLNGDGAIDKSFGANTDNTIYDVEAQVDGKVLIGGDFENVNGGARTSIARLLSEPLLQRRARFDFDGDNKTDVSIFRPAAGQWWYLRSSDGSNRAFGFGSSADKIVPADFTGDGAADLAFWRESSGEWFVLRSEDNSFYSFPFGTSGDIPVPADFDGDGFADAAVFRPSNATWYILNSSGGTTISQFGVSEDIPMPEDYDGDGKADLAVFRPSVSQWWIGTSTGGNLSFQFGASGDKPLSADFTGDGKADVAVWRAGSGEWFILRSEDASYYSVPFGLAGDIPAAGDYDGDGIADVAVFRTSSNVWYLQQSTNGFSAVTFGAAGDQPVPAAFVP